MRYAMKDAGWERVGESLVVVCDPIRQIELHDPDGAAERLLECLAAGPAALPEIRQRLAERGLEVTDAELGLALATFDDLRLLEDVEGRSLGTAARDERHHSNLAFYGLFATTRASRATYQQRVEDAHVLQLGTGGLGSNVLQSLAGLGVRRLTVLDHDLVEPRNLARQFLYRTCDIGSSKVLRAAEWLRAFDPRIDVTAVERRVEGPEDVSHLLGDVDLVICGIDTPDAVGTWVNEACVTAGVPWLRGGIVGSQLRYYSVDPGRSACRGPCLDSSQDTSAAVVAGSRASLRLLPVNHTNGPAAALIGSLVAFEALRYLTGYEEPYAAGAVVSVDLAAGCVQEREPWPADPSCEVCRTARERVGSVADLPAVAARTG